MRRFEYSKKLSVRFIERSYYNYDKGIIVSLEDCFFNDLSINGKMKIENRNPETIFTTDHDFMVQIKTIDGSVYKTVNKFACIHAIYTKFSDLAIMPDSSVIIDFDGQTRENVIGKNIVAFSIRNYIDNVGFVFSDWVPLNPRNSAIHKQGSADGKHRRELDPSR